MDNSNHEETASGSNTTDDNIDELCKFFQLGLFKCESVPVGPPKLENPTIESIVKYIQSGKCKKIITMAGAGISTSAGIPDFRSPGSGLYDNLEKYKLPHPMAIFELDYFRHRPEAFFTLAKELYPGSFKPTPCHYFLKLLEQKGLLLRHFTQNIDNLERIAGLSDDTLVEAHGSFHKSHCLSCKKEYSLEWMKERIFSDIVPTCDNCNGIVKPDIVFFGENLPSRYFHRSESDFPEADLLIVMGTSLVVQPFCSLVDSAPPDCPRLLINKEKVGESTTNRIFESLGLLTSNGLRFDSKGNVRDVFLQGDCDSGCQNFADMLGWGDELKQLIQSEHTRLDEEIKKEKEERTLANSLKKTSLGENSNDKKSHETEEDSKKSHIFDEDSKKSHISEEENKKSHNLNTEEKDKRLNKNVETSKIEEKKLN